MNRRDRAKTATGAGLLLIVLALCLGPAQARSRTSAIEQQPSAPPWMRDLVLYSLEVKYFTSPNGPATGTFDSLKARLPYLHDLGITGIDLLGGVSEADPNHYKDAASEPFATVDPSKIDPSLGTPKQFKALVDEAHRLGLKVFVTAITHGLVFDSPIVVNHPRWFRGISYRMAEYDWNGGHTDLDDWWVDLWTNFAKKYGVDGFGLDVSGFRMDLWARIRQNASSPGHPVAIYQELSSAVPGVTDFSMHDAEMYNDNTRTVNPLFMNDFPGYYARKFGRVGNYKVEIEFEDGAKLEGSTDGKGALAVQFNGLTKDMVSSRDEMEEYPWIMGRGEYPVYLQMSDGLPDLELSVGTLPDGDIRNVKVWSDGNFLHLPDPYSFEQTRGFNGRPGELAIERTGDKAKIYVTSLRVGNVMSFFGMDVQNSRATFGYSLLFSPMIPDFVAGQEFDAILRPVPGSSADLYEMKDPGTVGVLLDWSQLGEPIHRSMMEDVRRMLLLRRQEWDVLAPEVRGDVEPRLIAVPYSSDIEIPAPYMRWRGTTAIIVVANRNTTADARLRLAVPVETLGPLTLHYAVTDLWNGGDKEIVSAEELHSLPCIVRPDHTPRGGISLLRIERLPN